MTTEKHAIICGYGRTGQYLARLLTLEGVSYVALDLDPDRVREAAAAGETVVYGDSWRRETLIAAGIMRASVLIVSFGDAVATMKVLHQAAQLRPDLPVVVRATDEAHIERFAEAGGRRDGIRTRRSRRCADAPRPRRPLAGTARVPLRSRYHHGPRLQTQGRRGRRACGATERERRRAARERVAPGTAPK